MARFRKPHDTDANGASLRVSRHRRNETVVVVIDAMRAKAGDVRATQKRTSGLHLGPYVLCAISRLLFSKNRLPRQGRDLQTSALPPHPNAIDAAI